MDKILLLSVVSAILMSCKAAEVGTRKDGRLSDGYAASGPFVPTNTEEVVQTGVAGTGYEMMARQMMTGSLKRGGLLGVGSGFVEGPKVHYGFNEGGYGQNDQRLGGIGLPFKNRMSVGNGDSYGQNRQEMSRMSVTNGDGYGQNVQGMSRMLGSNGDGYGQNGQGMSRMLVSNGGGYGQNAQGMRGIGLPADNRMPFDNEGVQNGQGMSGISISANNGTPVGNEDGYGQNRMSRMLVNNGGEYWQDGQRLSGIGLPAEKSMSVGNEGGYGQNIQGNRGMGLQAGNNMPFSNGGGYGQNSQGTNETGLSVDKRMTVGNGYGYGQNGMSRLLVNNGGRYEQNGQILSGIGLPGGKRMSVGDEGGYGQNVQEIRGMGLSAGYRMPLSNGGGYGQNGQESSGIVPPSINRIPVDIENGSGLNTELLNSGRAWGTLNGDSVNEKSTGYEPGGVEGDARRGSVRQGLANRNLNNRQTGSMVNGRPQENLFNNNMNFNYAIPASASDSFRGLFQDLNIGGDKLNKSLLKEVPITGFDGRGLKATPSTENCDESLVVQDQTTGMTKEVPVTGAQIGISSLPTDGSDGGRKPLLDSILKFRSFLNRERAGFIPQYEAADNIQAREPSDVVGGKGAEYESSPPLNGKYGAFSGRGYYDSENTNKQSLTRNEDLVGFNSDYSNSRYLTEQTEPKPVDQVNDVSAQTYTGNTSVLEDDQSTTGPTVSSPGEERDDQKDKKKRKKKGKGRRRYRKPQIKPTEVAISDADVTTVIENTEDKQNEDQLCTTPTAVNNEKRIDSRDRMNKSKFARILNENGKGAKGTKDEMEELDIDMFQEY